MHLSLKQLCDAIEAGYAAEKSGLDDDMVDLLAELSYRTSEIKELIQQSKWLGDAIFGQDLKGSS